MLSVSTLYHFHCHSMCLVYDELMGLLFVFDKSIRMHADFRLGSAET